MFRIITACALILLTAAAVIPDDAQANIVSYQNENDGSGNYNFSFETSNGIIRKETGRLINAGAENQYVDVQGSYYYKDTDGQLVEVNYHADENGYHIVPKLSSCITDSPLFRACMEAEETVAHVLFECTGVTQIRTDTLGTLKSYTDVLNRPGDITNFWREVPMVVYSLPASVTASLLGK